MERRETGGFIVDAYLSNDIDDYIYTVNRPILYLKTVTGGELKAIVCAKAVEIKGSQGSFWIKWSFS